MSEEFHVHGPHDHEVEHQAQHDPFAGRIAVMTAIFATISRPASVFMSTVRLRLFRFAAAKK